MGVMGERPSGGRLLCAARIQAAERPGAGSVVGHQDIHISPSKEVLRRYGQLFQLDVLSPKLSLRYSCLFVINTVRWKLAFTQCVRSSGALESVVRVASQTDTNGATHRRGTPFAH